jgi:predicted alpha/beta-fold hydrolase
MGFSLGANWLALALGKSKHLSGILEAATCIQPPLQVSKAHENFKLTWYGLVNWRLGKRYKRLLQENFEYLYPAYKQFYDIDLNDFIANLRGVN